MLGALRRLPSTRSRTGMVAGRAWLGWDGGAAGGALGLGQQRRGIFFIGRRPTRSELFAKLDDTRLVMEPNFTLEVIEYIERAHNEQYRTSENLQMARFLVMCERPDRARTYVQRIPEHKRNAGYYAGMIMTYLGRPNVASGVPYAVEALDKVGAKKNPVQLTSHFLAYARRLAEEADDAELAARVNAAVEASKMEKMPHPTVTFAERRARAEAGEVRMVPVNA